MKPDPAGQFNQDSPAPSPGGDEAPSEGTDSGTGSLDYLDDDSADDTDAPAPEGRPPAPMPATINLIVHACTLFGWDTTPSEAAWPGSARRRRDPVDRGRGVPALRHPLVRDGNRPRRYRARPRLLPRSAPPGSPKRASRASRASTTAPARRIAPATRRTPTFTQAGQLDDFLRRLNVALAPVAKGACDHATAEPRYTPSRRLAHLVRARTATCDAPGCAAQAVHADLDHTTPYPDGPTDQCNLSPKCRMAPQGQADSLKLRK